MASSTPVALLLLIVIMCFVVLCIVYNIRDYEQRPLRATALVGGGGGGGSQSEAHKRDCDAETVYSVTDSQCRVVCRQPGVFASRNGACVNALAFGTDEVSNKCDPKRGVLAFLLGDPQFGDTEMRCYSVDPGIQPDDPNGKNAICEYGSADIDYVKSFPQSEACRCTDPAKSVLAFVNNTRTVRRRGVCVSEKMAPLYRHNDLLHDGSSPV